MSLEAIREWFMDRVREHMALAEPIVFLMGFAESIPGLSLAVPSTPLFLAIGGVHGAAGGQFWHVWLAASIGAVVGDCVTYALGRWLKKKPGRMRALRLSPEAIAKAEAMFARWGSLAVIVGKFTGFARPFIPIVAGAVAMPFPLFLAASSFSSLLWAGLFLGPGYGLKWLVG